jgi:hypothetical protein
VLVVGPIAVVPIVVVVGGPVYGVVITVVVVVDGPVVVVVGGPVYGVVVVGGPEYDVVVGGRVGVVPLYLTHCGVYVISSNAIIASRSAPVVTPMIIYLIVIKK